jgi:hypothetical protein
MFDGKILVKYYTNSLQVTFKRKNWCDPNFESKLQIYFMFNLKP